MKYSIIIRSRRIEGVELKPAEEHEFTAEGQVREVAFTVEDGRATGFVPAAGVRSAAGLRITARHGDSVVLGYPRIVDEVPDEIIATLKATYGPEDVEEYDDQIQSLDYIEQKGWEAQAA